ncbi:MAG: hypothetical protein RLZZ126_987 [Pseudomonadota bacterium]|jgi:uracil-DNA glycosylase
MSSIFLENIPQLTRSQLDAAVSGQGVASDWKGLVTEFWQGGVGRGLQSMLRSRLDAGVQVYPPEPLRALALTPLARVRVMILGQDPYHGPGQAHGLAFSVQPGVRTPPSLKNIGKQLEKEDFLEPGAHKQLCSLEAWARQGVLLLNTTLTVEDAQPASHAKLGWEVLTDTLVQACAQKESPVVFMLWGGHAQTKRALIETTGARTDHLVLMANHPSPLSALRAPSPFIGCGHFAAANQHLRRHGAAAIDWGAVQAQKTAAGLSAVGKTMA